MKLWKLGQAVKPDNELGTETLKKLSYNPDLLIDICQEMSGNIGGDFNVKD